MAANAGAVDHVLPVVGQSEIDQRLQESIPDALFCPAPEPDIDRVPLAVSLVHVAPRAADPQHMQHPIEEAPIIARWPRPATTLRRQQRPDQFPFSIRQIPAAHDYSSKSSLESQLGVVGNPFCQHGLMLSGVGPESELQRHSIPVRFNIPGIGLNLQDHPDHVTVYRAKSPDLFAVSPGGVARIGASIPDYIRNGRGPLTSNAAEGGAFLSTKGRGNRPDVQMHFVHGIIDDHSRKIHLGGGMSCHVCVLRPESRGSVTLGSADPLAPPVIDPNFLATDGDIKTLLSGFKLVRDIMESDALKSIRGTELFTKGMSGDSELIDAIRARADTVYHPVGTCRMGNDEAAVCDEKLKVRGIQNIWIADASVMPNLISGNTNAPVAMIAERAAEFILENQK